MAHDHARTSGAGNRARIAIALAIVAAVLVVEVIGGLLTGSLTLLADAGHMSTDTIGLVVALVASVLAARPATDRHTFGFQRFEVLAALVNGLLLTGVAVVVGLEAVRRLAERAEAEILGLPMLAVAALGLAANVAAFLVLRGGDRGSLNLRGAMLEVLGDLLGSVLAIAAALVILLTGFAPADAIASLLVAVLIVPRAALLLRDVVRVLLESAPRDTSVELIRSHLLETSGVVAVHDVHVWQLSTDAPVFTAHVVVEPRVLEGGGSSAMLESLGECLREHFDVAHSTFQLEPAGHAEAEEPGHR